MTQNLDSFLDFVQAHERTWGTETYPGRPTLEAMLEGHVVVFWLAGGNDQRMIVTIHTSLEELQSHFGQLIFRSSIEPPKRRVVKIFQDKQLVRVKGIRVLFEVAQ